MRLRPARACLEDVSTSSSAHAELNLKRHAPLELTSFNVPLKVIYTCIYILKIIDEVLCQLNQVNAGMLVRAY